MRPPSSPLSGHTLSSDTIDEVSTIKVINQESSDDVKDVVVSQNENEEQVTIRCDLQDYVLPKCKVWPESELQPVEAFVSQAIQSQHEPSEDPATKQGYKALVDGIRRPRDPEMIEKILICLRTAGHGSCLHQVASSGAKHAHLIHVIFKFNPFDVPRSMENSPNEILQPYLEYSIADAHLQLLAAIISAKSVHAVPVMNAMWNLFSGRSDVADPIKFRIHAMLATIMRLCPKTRSEIFTIIASNAPFWTRNKGELTGYYRECFTVLEYLPSLRRPVLELVIDKCLEIDVNIRIMDSGEVALGDEDDDEGDVFPLDMEMTESKEERESKKESEVNVLSDKLDCILFMLFKHIQDVATDEVQARNLYRELLPVFESSILTTHKSKFVQFCIFLLCGLESKAIKDSSKTDSDGGSNAQDDEVLHRQFAGKLIETIVDPYRATLTRQSGCCYLASLVSRASYVCPETVCESVSVLLRWAEAYIDSVSATCIRAVDSRHQSEFHSLFYTVCQAAFYIMCFRGGDAMNFCRSALECHESLVPTDEFSVHSVPDPTYIDMSSTRWTRICAHELQPLRFCLESVRDEFLHVANVFGLIEESVYGKLMTEAKRLSTGHMLKKKAVSRISTIATLEKQRLSGGVGGLGRGSNPLKSFFPFDPLLLRRSHRFIEPYYNNWQGPIDEDDDEDDHSHEEEDDHTSDSLSGGSESGSEDEASVVELGAQDSAWPVQPMSLASSCGTPEDGVKTDSMEQAWDESTKRLRSHSIENGSW